MQLKTNVELVKFNESIGVSYMLKYGNLCKTVNYFLCFCFLTDSLETCKLLIPSVLLPSWMFECLLLKAGVNKARLLSRKAAKSSYKSEV